jgi:hypothetical protein
MADFPTTRSPAPLGFGAVREEAEPAPAETPWRPRTNGLMPIFLLLGAVVLGARRGLAGAAAGRPTIPSARARG